MRFEKNLSLFFYLVWSNEIERIFVLILALITSFFGDLRVLPVITDRNDNPHQEAIKIKICLHEAQVVSIVH